MSKRKKPVTLENLLRFKSRPNRRTSDCFFNFNPIACCSWMRGDVTRTVFVIALVSAMISFVNLEPYN